jgi:hypothetical protein
MTQMLLTPLGAYMAPELHVFERRKPLEVKRNNGRLITATTSEHLETSVFVDIINSGRYVLMLQPKKWQHLIYDVHLSNFFNLPRRDFIENLFD